MAEIFNSLRSLGFGAMLGGGVLGLIYAIFPTIFSGSSIGLSELVLLGGLIGGGGHQLIDSWFIKGLLKPIGDFTSYYSKLLQLALIRNSLPTEQYDEILKDITNSYFRKTITSRSYLTGPTKKP